MAVISGFSELLRLLFSRAEKLNLEGRVDEGLKAYMEAYQFAHESARGGILEDYYSSARMKIKVMTAVQSIIPKISSSEAGEFLQLIDIIESDEENSLEKVMIRDECWKDAAYGYSLRVNRIKYYVNRVVQQRSLSVLYIMLFSDMDAYHKNYQSDYLEPVKVMLRKQAAGVPSLP